MSAPVSAQEPQPGQNAPAATPGAAETGATPETAKGTEAAPDCSTEADVAAGCSTGTESGEATPNNGGSNNGSGNNAAAGMGKVNREGTSNDRIFDLLPNYMTVEQAGKLPPLTPGEKYALAADGIFDKVELVFYGVLAGINQLNHENPSWGYSWGGYARRYGEQFLNESIEDMTTEAVFPSLFHQDPRYYQLGKGNYPHRFAYAASRIFVARTDKGASTFNDSEILGSFSAAAIANVYEPRESRTVSNTCQIWTTEVLIDALSYELREFWPDMHRGMRYLGSHM